MVITFNELRRIKDSLPDGSMKVIADKLSLPIATVRNYFGGANYEQGQSTGLVIEQGPDGGVVSIQDTTIYEMARNLLHEKGLKS